MESKNVADKIELAELVSKWNLYTDEENFIHLEDYLDLWSKKNPVLINPFGTFSGIEEIKKWQQGYNVAGGPAFGRRHTSVNVVSKIKSENEADIFFDFYLNEVNEIPYLVATARNKIVAIKEDGIWKIQSYTFALDPGFMKAMEKAGANN